MSCKQDLNHLTEIVKLAMPLIIYDVQIRLNYLLLTVMYRRYDSHLCFVHKSVTSSEVTFFLHLRDVVRTCLGSDAVTVISLCFINDCLSLSLVPRLSDTMTGSGLNCGPGSPRQSLASGVWTATWKTVFGYKWRPFWKIYDVEMSQ